MKPKSMGPPAGERATTEKLLDTAERLFAEHGYDGVGMRALADEAGVNLGATTYHYGSKEKLYVETFLRRFRAVNATRLELLRQAELAANGKPLLVETIVDCLMRPPFLTVLEHPNFPVLLARNLFMPPPFMRRLLEKEMAPSIQPFVQALTKALPKLPPQCLMTRLMFAGGALLMFAGQLGGMPHHLRSNAGMVEAVLAELIKFTATGLRSDPTATVNNLPPHPLAATPPRV